MGKSDEEGDGIRQQRIAQQSQTSTSRSWRRKRKSTRYLALALALPWLAGREQCCQTLRCLESEWTEWVKGQA
eukprot:3093845-Rhodomonas_salina.1